MTRPLPKLEPCPWPGCEEKPTLVRVSMDIFSDWYVGCINNRQSHWIMGPTQHTQYDAVVMWNRRDK